jgi:hypothetical protein
MLKALVLKSQPSARSALASVRLVSGFAARSNVCLGWGADTSYLAERMSADGCRLETLGNDRSWALSRRPRSRLNERQLIRIAHPRAASPLATMSRR